MASSPQQVVEHVVLFGAREGVQRSATEAWAKEARSLAGLEGVLHLYVGAVRSCKPEPDAWSCALYGRYRDKAALEAYAVHPQHLQLVSHGSTIFSDVMALDWEAHVSDIPPSSSPPSALRVAFLQFKPDSSHDNDATSSLHGRPFSTSGPNFSPARARGFEWGSISLHWHDDEPQDDHVCVQVLSKSSAVEKFLIVDIDVMDGTNGTRE